jgi:thiamine monophosphate kinase
MKQAVAHRDVIRVGSVIFASGAIGALQAALTGWNETRNLKQGMMQALLTGKTRLK